MKKTYYQWTKGDRKGEIVYSEGDLFTDEDGIEYLVLGHGEILNKSLVWEYLIEIPSPQEPLILRDQAPQPLQKIDKQSEALSPLEKLLKDSKKTPTDMLINVTVNLPSYDLLKILADNYENGEEEIIKYLASSIIDNNDIHKLLANEIKNIAFQQKSKKNERTKSRINNTI